MNMGNPKRSSRFICLHCLKINQLGSGIQRGGKQREKYHIKDLYCPICGSVEKCIEIRWCDTYEDVYDKAIETREIYYEEENNSIESEVDQNGTEQELCK